MDEKPKVLKAAAVDASLEEVADALKNTRVTHLARVPVSVVKGEPVYLRRTEATRDPVGDLL